MSEPHAGDEPSGCPVAEELSRTYDPFSTSQLECPFPVWERARSEAPVFFSEVLNTYVITRYEDYDRIVRDPELFSNTVFPQTYKNSPEVDRIL
jgi:cytochrome P450